jgi:hypothetical protein
VRDGSSAPLVKCHSGCNGQADVEELRRRGWWPIEQRERSADRPKRTAADTQRYIMELWRHSRPIEGTLVETYLRARGITVAVPPSFRFHPSLKHTDTELSFPTMVAAVQAPDRSITGLHRTFLRADGAGKAQVTSPRKMLGSVRSGAVRLAAVHSSLALGEGLETCLAYMQLTGTPTWSVLSAAGFRFVILPALPLASTVFLLVDLDPAGEEATTIAANRFAREGRAVKLVRPTIGKDIADAMNSRRLT